MKASSALLQIERPVHGGRFLARAPNGAVVLIAGVIPGERVQARLQERQGVLFGEVLELLEASAERLAPPEHPGLDYGHIEPALQLRLKHQTLIDAAQRAGALLPGEPPPVVASPQLWGYRNSVQPAVLARSAAGSELGYRRPGGHEVVAVRSDPTANEASAAAYAALRALKLPKGVVEVAIRGTTLGESLVALVGNSFARDLHPLAHALLEQGVAGVALAPFDERGRFRGGAQRLAGVRSVRERYGAVEVQLTPSAFGQPNPLAAAALFERLCELAPAALHALDLYGGSGVIGRHLIGRAERVSVLDIDRGSIDRGREAAAAAGVQGIEFLRQDARSLQVPSSVDLIVVDPPRAGLAAPTREAIVASGARTLLYVSCDSATWARDVAAFQRAGFALEHVEPFDFQPHTHHLEILSLLRRA